MMQARNSRRRRARINVPEIGEQDEQPDEAVVAFCRRAGLIRNLDETRFARLRGGVASDIWRVEADGRIFCVKQALARLRVAADWRAPTERNIYEARWLRAAASIAPDAVPELLADDPQAGMFAMSYLPSETHPRWKDRLMAGDVDIRLAAQVGATLSVLHSAFARNTKMPELFPTCSIFEDIRISPYLRATAERHPDLRAPLDALAERTLTTRRTLVHGDISPKNILIGPAGPVFIDAECAWYGDPAFDLAFCLNHLLLKCLVARDAVESLTASFSALSDAYLGSVDWEPADALEARAASLLPALFLARVDGHSPVEYLTKEVDRQRVRNVARPLLAAFPERLEYVRVLWLDELARERKG